MNMRFQLFQFSDPIRFFCPVCRNDITKGKIIILMLNKKDLEIKGCVLEAITCCGKRLVAPVTFFDPIFARSYISDLTEDSVLLAEPESFDKMLRNFGTNLDLVQSMVNIEHEEVTCMMLPLKSD